MVGEQLAVVRRERERRGHASLTVEITPLVDRVHGLITELLSRL
jgi:hypothetical protein